MRCLRGLCIATGVVVRASENDVVRDIDLGLSAGASKTRLSKYQFSEELFFKVS